MIDRANSHWYKDAVVYQLHVKAFCDASGDGVGDFAGLINKLDYIQDLGATAVWLLPFYPSPLRDDGYDIADYRDVHAAYGTLRDFRALVRAAHQRGLRVIIELVVNHTSDQHPWFQRARHAPPGSTARKYYVWSDTDQKYRKTRVIFLDTEKSNWAWDPVAQAYYWHRFYHHQPDLNFDNPRVLREVISILRFWLDLGVDGLRLDAVPYLVEREGTSCENLPETHAILKTIRREVDARYTDRMLLAEANQWPEDAQEYFGSGNECHMAFHFPLMPRMYMAIAQEDRHPIIDIMRQTPEIPSACQWAIFLRNHDELTLEMVTDHERDYLWGFYAADRRMRINLGIRRRLAPLMDNDRRKIELLNGLLMSMPGTPVVYYGDELGMGDNIFLGDRDGVRTPMQWSPDRNGGFSRADPASLYLPPNMDPVYGYEAVNVEAQLRSSSSLLNWMKRLIAIRKQHATFGRGKLTFLHPGNRKVLAYLREHESETILCVANLSRSAQAVELDLAPYKGRVPLELRGRSPFPPIGDLPYLLTLPSYGFFWFTLAEETAIPAWHETLPEPMPDFLTLVLRHGWTSLSSGKAADELQSIVLPDYLPKQRWFASKDVKKRKPDVRLAGWAGLGTDDQEYWLAQLDVKSGTKASSRRYFVPLAISWDAADAAIGGPLQPFTLARVRHKSRTGCMYDALVDEHFARTVVDAMRRGDPIPASDGTLRFTAADALRNLDLPADATVRRLGVEQSNSSVILGEAAILKTFRNLVQGLHPEIEMGRFLTDVAQYPSTPPLLGTIEHVSQNGSVTALAVLQGYVENQGDGWTYTLDYLDRSLEECRLRLDGGDAPTDPDCHGLYLAQARHLGQRTAELHIALAMPTDDPAFSSEPITRADMKDWRAAVRQQAEEALAAVQTALPELSEQERAIAEDLLGRRRACLQRIDKLTAGTPKASKTRVHTDLHLGQILVVQDDLYILDFEGEPARPLPERRAKLSPLKDVAGLVRSFDYAAWESLNRLTERGNEVSEGLREHAEQWRHLATAAFLDGYRHTAQLGGVWPQSPEDAQRLIDLFILDKALYEICYEAGNRPSWLHIPIRGALGVLAPSTPRPPLDIDPDGGGPPAM